MRRVKSIIELPSKKMSSSHVYICFLLILSSFTNASPRKDGARRLKRSVMELSGMVTDVTGRQATEFVSYGHWCGLGGSGDPVDPIDECCQVHDLCYDLTTRGPCRSLGEKGPYTTEYKWKKADDGSAQCDEDKDVCKRSVCTCDALLTNCLKTNIDFYDKQYLHKLSVFELLKEANYLSNP